MRVLILYRHFWPDSPPYAAMLRSIGAHLVAEGHEVHVIAQMPCYRAHDRVLRPPRREVLDGIAVRRLGLLPGARRFRVLARLDAALFPLRAAWAARRAGRFGAVIAATIPPALNGLGARWAARATGARLIYHCQDIYPEMGALSGLWREGSLVHRLLARIDRKTRRRAHRLVALSEDMAETLVAGGVARRRIEIVNNFELERFDPGAAPPPALARTGRFRAVFAGNLGRFQGLEAVIDAARLLAASHPDIELLLLGDGAMRRALEARAAGLGNVIFHPHLPYEKAAPAIAAADIGLISLGPGIHRAAYPSKTLTYLGLGLPVLAVVDADSALAREIAAEGAGIVAAGRTPEAIAAALAEAWDRRADLAGMRARARAWHARALSRKAALEKWSALIAGMAP